MDFENTTPSSYMGVKTTYDFKPPRLDQTQFKTQK